jgi:hypothetical protein
VAWISVSVRLPPDTRDYVRVGFRRTDGKVADWGACCGSVVHECMKRGELHPRVVWWHSGSEQQGEA